MSDTTLIKYGAALIGLAAMVAAYWALFATFGSHDIDFGLLIFAEVGR